MSIEEHLQLWNHSAIRVIDIRRSMMHPGDMLTSFRLPSSAFLFIHRGNAQVCIDMRAHSVNGYYVCHAGKGSLLDIVQVQERIEYDLIFYKATLALPHRKELLRLYRDNSPFQAAYGFMPGHPLALYSKAEQMRQLV